MIGARLCLENNILNLYLEFVQRQELADDARSYTCTLNSINSKDITSMSHRQPKRPAMRRKRQQPRHQLKQPTDDWCMLASGK